MSERSPYQRLSRQTLFTTPFGLRLAHDRYVLPRGGQGDYYFLLRRDSVMMLPLFADGRLRLVKQHRYLHGRDSLEFPSGALETNEQPLAGAKRELREEAGLTARSWRAIGTIAPQSGLTTETCHLYVAEQLSEVPTEPDPSEEFVNIDITREQLVCYLADGTVWDTNTIAAIAMLDAVWRR
jgi:8-oxo-dGTP pyrophosphatase MutT (NUDIX family)